VRSLAGPPLPTRSFVTPEWRLLLHASTPSSWLHSLTQKSMAFVLSEEHERAFADILSRYPNKMAACIPVLHLCQEANGNWLSPEAIQFVAARLDLSPAHVKGVVTFYSLFNEHPPGKHQVWVCRTLSCALRGSDAILAHCERRLGVSVGGTTADGQFTLRTAECLASCGTAPMMQVDKTYYEELTPEKVDQILAALAKN
jgi:NADH-quinone oxidoreductase subunit E